MGAHAMLKTKEEVDRILKDIYEKEDFHDPKVEIQAGCNKGDGFLSSMNKITVSENGKQLNLIMKCAPKSEGMRKMVPLEAVFKREIRFYDEIYPQLVKFQEEKNVASPFHHVPKVYMTCVDEMEEAVTMEDIKQFGFDTHDKRKPMDDEHISHVMNQYGQFHAISFAMQDQNRELYDKITDGLDDEWWKFGDAILQQIVGYMRKMGDYFNGEGDEKKRETVMKFVDQTIDYLRGMRVRSKYHVINHGDCWCNNMMFKYENDKVSEMRLIDFQLSRCSTPAYDLSYFLYMSGGKTALDNLDHYLKMYYESLKKHTKEMGSDVEKLYPFSALKEDWKTYGKYGIILAMSLTKTVMMDQDEVLDLTDAAKNGFGNLPKVMKNEQLADERLKGLCEFVIENGFI